MAIPNMAMIPSGYKPTKLYSVLPTPALSEVEKVTNGDFSNGSTDWTIESNWTIANGVANGNGANGSNQELTQAAGLTAGKTYSVSYEVKNYVSGSVKASKPNGMFRTANGVYTENITVNAANIIFRGTSFNGSITNISIKEVITADADFTVTRASSATRVNEQGLIETPEFIIGGELMPSIGSIVNGGPGMSITQISGNSYSSLSDGVSTSAVRPKIDLDTVLGKTYRVVINPLGTISGTINLRLYDGVSYVMSTYDLSTEKSIEFTNVGAAFLAFKGSNVYSISEFTVSVVQVERENIPRLDYTDGGCPVLLTEPQSTNLITYSEDFSTWDLKEGTETLNYGVSPDGTQNSTRIVFASTQLQFSNFITTGASTTGSVYIKGIDGETINFGLAGAEEIFTLNGGWQRFQKSGTTTNNKITINTYSAATARDIQVWGAQLEPLPYATSYMPTYNGIASRAGETVSNAGDANTFNSTEGVLFAEVAAFTDDEDTRISINDGTTNNYISIGYSRFSGNIIAEIFAGGVLQTTDWGAIGVNKLINHKFALSWGSGTMSFYMDGSISNTESVTSPTGLNKLTLANAGSNLPFYGKTKQVQVFNTALTDAELQTLTTI